MTYEDMINEWRTLRTSTASDVELVCGALFYSTINSGHEEPIVRKLAAVVLAR